MLRIGILGSTRGTSMLPIIQAIEQKACPAEIVLVLSNKADALILKNAAHYGLNAQFLNPADLTREAYDEKITHKMREHGVQIILLIGYMKILSKTFLEQWQHKILNVHPSLLPLHAGKMDLAVHQAVLEAQEKISGCTVHFVTEEVDAGPVIIQKECQVFEDDTAETLKQRVQQLEGPALLEAIMRIYEKHNN